jgi:hypothetical protein
MSKKLQVRIPQVVYQWAERRAKKLGFRTISGFIRHLLSELRLEDIRNKDNKQ